MKRLFYATNNLDDAESISDEVHKLGIDDHHFYVLSRDDSGIKSHHLHGSSNIDKTDIIAAKKRAKIMSFGVSAIIVAIIALSTNTLNSQLLWAIFAAICAYVVINFILLITGGSFDGYFKSVINERLDSGEVIIIIDVEKAQSKKVEQQLDAHAQAQFLADSSNLASPIPD
ncbi:hypothetical protein [Pseudoalteromonas sp. MMG012]|uniref:hypothetical protein n=1 Tax=Pseudoalteromonas sp. MMG012 TaxID=2822686 RepID=UPI001B3A62AA|nr:hypothetical protein [Pseudoalteromonas sp. MMG012]MBQ4851378.1 hypothetical protein [Pseudoalteromonas sp. MMG012]